MTCVSTDRSFKAQKWCKQLLDDIHILLSMSGFQKLNLEKKSLRLHPLRQSIFKRTCEWVGGGWNLYFMFTCLIVKYSLRKIYCKNFRCNGEARTRLILKFSRQIIFLPNLLIFVCLSLCRNKLIFPMNFEYYNLLIFITVTTKTLYA